MLPDYKSSRADSCRFTFWTSIVVNLSVIFCAAFMCYSCRFTFWTSIVVNLSLIFCTAFMWYLCRFTFYEGSQRKSASIKFLTCSQGFVNRFSQVMRARFLADEGFRSNFAHRTPNPNSNKLQMTSLELPRRQVAAQNAMKSGTRNVPCYSHKECDVPEHYIPDNTQPTPWRRKTQESTA